MHHHRVEVVTTAAAWVGIGDDFGKPSMETILSCAVLRVLNTIWDTTSELKTRGEAASQELSVKDGKRDKESVSTGGLIPHKDPLCFMTCSSPRRTFFLHALSFECTSKLCGTFPNRFSDYFNI